MSKPKDNEFETYYIPPNFIEGSTLFGGLFKLRNAIEAGILAVGAGLPVFPAGYTTDDADHYSVPDRPSPGPSGAVRRIGRMPVVLYLCFLQMDKKPACGRNRP